MVSIEIFKPFSRIGSVALNCGKKKDGRFEFRCRMNTPVSYTHLDVYKRQHIHTEL